MQSSKNEPMCDVQDKALKQVCVVGSKNEWMKKNWQYQLKIQKKKKNE
jgi:hypothetical protein